MRAVDPMQFLVQVTFESGVVKEVPCENFYKILIGNNQQRVPLIMEIADKLRLGEPIDGETCNLGKIQAVRI